MNAAAAVVAVVAVCLLAAPGSAVESVLTVNSTYCTANGGLFTSACVETAIAEANALPAISEVVFDAGTIGRSHNGWVGGCGLLVDLRRPRR